LVLGSGLGPGPTQSFGPGPRTRDLGPGPLPWARVGKHENAKVSCVVKKMLGVAGMSESIRLGES